MNQVINYAFLGGSRIALKMAHAARLSGNSRVVALASRSERRLQDFRKIGVDAAVSDYAAALVDRRVQAVYISLPNSLHYEWAKNALLHDKHVLCEKPMVLESSQLRELMGLAASRGLVLMEAFWYRYHPLLDRIRGMIRSGELGRLGGFHSTFSFLTHDDADIRWTSALGGGAINDLFCYHADAIRYLTGMTCADIATIEGFARHRNDVDASVCIEIGYRSGLQAQVVASIERNSSNMTLISGDKGVLTIPHLRLDPGHGDHSCSFLSAEGARVVDEGHHNPYIRMLTAFSLAVQGRSDAHVVALDESLDNVRLIELARKAVAQEMQDRIGLYPAVLSFSQRLMRRFVYR